MKRLLGILTALLAMTLFLSQPNLFASQPPSKPADKESLLRDVRNYILPGVPASPFMKTTWYNSSRYRWTVKSKSAEQTR